MADPAPTPSGRTALVTGAGSGIGRAIAHRLHRDGCRVALADIDAARAGAAAHALDASGATARGLALDVAAPSSVTGAFAEIELLWGGVDILVNSAGIAGVHPFLDYPLADWRRVLDVNVTGAFLCGQAAARAMVARRYGRIVNIASISGVRASIGRTAYGTSKAAIIGLTRQMAIELAPHGVTANAIAPGPTETEMVRRHHPPEMRDAYNKAVPAGRYATPEEIADAAAYLCAASAGYINGVVLPVDGGFLAAGIL
jgi:NAD(P)-dependent dehydrogenase (short-subunit alcohol dehydrogenase family)